MHQTDLERFEHLQHKPDGLKHPNEIAWQQGFQAGWQAAADRWLNPPPYEPSADDTTTWLADEPAA